jgi:tetratricopeptide (TPR) repeat protein
VDALDAKQRNQLLSEAEAAASLLHPAIVKIYQVGEAAGTPFLVMEFIQGGSLAERLNEGPLPIDQAVAVVRSTAEAIHYAHGKGLVHRDLKPGNILLDPSGSPHVCDFGLAKRLDSKQTQHTTDVVGTPAYMPPEQARGLSADKRSDIYSLGATLYETLSGRSPFQAATPWETLNQVLLTDPVPLRQLNPTIPKDLETICAKCLEKDLARRFATAQEVADELDRFIAGQPIHSRPVSLFARSAKWCSRNKRVAALAATSLGLLLALGIGSTVVAFGLAAKNESIRMAEQKAVADRTAVVNSLKTLVDELYDDLSKSETTLKTREKMVNVAIEGLQSITLVDGDRRTDRISMLAHQRIGDLLSLRGATSEATKEFAKSIKIARAILSGVSEADDSSVQEQAKRDLALAIDALLVHRLKSLDFEGVSEKNKEVVSIVNDLLKGDPSDTKAFLLLVQSHAREMQVLRNTRQLQQVVAVGKNALTDVDRMLELNGNDSAARSIAADVHAALGRGYMETGDISKVEKIYFHFLAARKHLRQAIKLHPDEIALVEKLAVNDRMTGVLLTEIGANERAIEHLSDARKTFKALQQKSPANQMFRLLLANAHQEKADSLLRMRRWESSLEACRTVLGLITEGVHGPRLSVSGIDAIGEIATARMLALRQLLSDPVPLKDEAVWCEVPDSETEVYGLICAVERFVENSTTFELSARAVVEIGSLSLDHEFENLDDIFEYIETKSVSQPTQLRALHAQLRAHAVIAKNLSASGDPDGQTQAADLAAEISQQLKKLVSQNPGSVFSLVVNEPEFSWLRQTDAFKAIGMEIPGVD